MAHKRAPKSRSSSVFFHCPLSFSGSDAPNHSPSPAPKKTASRLSEISPPPQKKARFRRNAPGSPEYDAQPAVTIMTPTKPPRSLGKRLSFGSIKPDSPSADDHMGDQVSLESPVDIAKATTSRVKRVSKPSAKVTYMADAASESDTPQIERKTSRVSPSKKVQESISASPSPPAPSQKSKKGKARKVDTPPPAVSSEEEDPKPAELKPKSASRSPTKIGASSSSANPSSLLAALDNLKHSRKGDNSHEKPQRLYSSKPLAARTKAAEVEVVIISSDSEPELTPRSQKQPIMAKKTATRKPVVKSEESSEPLSKQKASRSMKARPSNLSEEDSEQDKATLKKASKGRKTPLRLPQGRGYIRSSHTDSNAASVEADVSSDPDLPRYPILSAIKASEKSAAPNQTDSDGDIQRSASKRRKRVIKSKEHVDNSPSWDIEKTDVAVAAQELEEPESSIEAEETPETERPNLASFELLPYSDREPQTDSYMMDFKVVKTLEKSIANTIKASVRFVNFGPFINFSRAALDLVESSGYRGLCLAGKRGSAVSLLTGLVVSCSLVKGRAGNNDSGTMVKSISVIPIVGEYEQYMAYIGNKMDGQEMHGPIYESSYLVFSTKKEDRSTDRGYATQSEPGTPAKNMKYCAKRTVAGSSASGWYSKPFPSYLQFSDDVPIYDIRGSGFAFEKEDFDRLKTLPIFTSSATPPAPKDLPQNSLVTVAHTVNSFNGKDVRKILALNVQFVLFHGYLAD
ncbi:hypothetical protein GALMADRAFT_210632 [Galerina marginata CBS 339.88]|uniref:Uncharacterized protein n=1 Tax=Galerina marginata (strain CBS 339.88) TaxID=685588 RepID=A0A067T336_GALM3|nr:hypothetical protein GALMADRAFT_210632 [Galerina marginata CBS 339.88]